MIGSSRTYAIGMAHFELAGGWRSLLLVCGGYLVLLGGGLGLFYYENMSSGARSGLTSAAVTLFLVVEALALVVFGSLRIAGAVRIDLSSKMIESHRLMPVPGWRAVMGYMLGAGMHPLVFALLNMALGYVFALATGTSLTNLTMSQAALISFALLLWAAACMGTFVTRQLYVIGMALGFFGMCSGAYVAIYSLFPGLAILVSPMLGGSIFSFSSSSSSGVMMWILPASFLSQAAVFSLLFVGACRRYRGTYRTTYTVVQAVLVVVTWSAISAVGYKLWPALHFRGGYGARDFAWESGQIIASTLAGMVLALLPLRTLTVLEKRERITGVQSVLVILVLSLAVGCIGLAAQGTEQATATTCMATILTVGAFMVTMYAIFRGFRWASGLLTALVVICAGMMLWIAPLVADVVRMIFTVRMDGRRMDGLGTIGTMSPVGMLINRWTEDGGVSCVPGLVFMWAVAGALGVLFWGISRRRGRRKAAAKLVTVNSGVPLSS